MSNSRVRTLNFLPEVFQTPTNAEFLSATLDQLVNPPNKTRIQGYIGSKFGYGIDATDFYVTEPNKVRTDYQLEPGVVFLKDGTSKAKDFLTYPGMLDALEQEGARVQNNSRLFESDFYSWDSFTDLDKIINFNQYYWLPDGPPAVTVGTASVFSSNEYVVNDLPNSYEIRELSAATGSQNPTLTLLRGGTYQFIVDQDSQFWIQAEPGISGFSVDQPTLSTREVLGVINNGASQGIVTFTVPPKDAQDDLVFPGNNSVDVISTRTFAEINGKLLSEIKNIDGITALNGLRVMFHDTGDLSEVGYVGTYYDEPPYDVNLGAPFSTSQTLTLASCDATDFTLASGDTSDLAVGQTVTFNEPVFGGVGSSEIYVVHAVTSSTTFQIASVLDAEDPLTLVPGTGAMTVNINEGLLEEGFEISVNDNFFKVQYVGDPSDPVIRLVPDGLIPTEENITVRFGNQWLGRNFFKNELGIITPIPFLTAPLDELFYQDGTNPNRAGVIRLIDSNITNTLNVETDILGKESFTSTNGVKFTNGLKVSFDGDVVPRRFLQGQYYVEGVGSSIELIPVESLLSPEGFTQSDPVPWDSTPFDIGNFDFNLFIPVQQDYITIARNALNKNAWARSNRWFHIDVITATAEYNNDPNILTNFATASAKAKRPIIEFYPNLRLFNSGTAAKAPVDFIDTRTKDALSDVAGKSIHYPDVEGFTDNTAVIAEADDTTSTTITVTTADIGGQLVIGMNIKDSTEFLPNDAKITDIEVTNGSTVITVSWSAPLTFAGASNASLVASRTNLNNFVLFAKSRIIFAADTDPNVRDKIYVADFSIVEGSTDPVITLAEAEDNLVLADEQVSILRGFNNEGASYYFDGTEWIRAQQKSNVNQPPLFDVFDSNGISLGDASVYNGTSFAGTTLFSYGRGFGKEDPILGFPIRFSATENVGDISFDVTFNGQTFDYTEGTTPVTNKINTGYVLNYNTRVDFTRELGWKTAVAPSTQYQVFSFDYIAEEPQTQFVCDIAMLDELENGERGWPRIQVYINNEWIDPSHYAVSVDHSSTLVSLHDEPKQDTVIQILLLSDQTSKKAYYHVPVNLNNNPFNEDLETVNIGDIRNQYRDIFINTPNTNGRVFGSNNLRDLGPTVSYGTKIIKNSASLALPGAFLRNNNHNLFDALLFNSREYVKFKQLLVSTVNRTAFEQRFEPSTILDDALDEITAAKDQLQAFFWSDMLPSKAPFRQNTYTFRNDLDGSSFPLSRVYDFEKANYNGVLVYLLRVQDGTVVEKQLLLNKDYFIAKDEAAVRVDIDIKASDKIVVKEYNQTFGSYVPNTPTKLGLYPSYEPAVVLDTAYGAPTYFIKGHDGSYTRLYGEYDAETDTLIDFRDQVLLEFEKRVYNNIKLDGVKVVNEYEIVPGFFRNTGYSWNDFLQTYSSSFLNWIGENRLDYTTQLFNKADPKTYNYANASNKLDKTAIQQGHWRGVYQFFYDTTTPNVTPWEMLGFSIKPDWWDNRYGPAPYTSDNEILWNDIEKGFVWNNGDSKIVPELARPGLSKILPVDSKGDLINALDAVVGNHSPSAFQRDWRVGDFGPVEFSYKRSSSYPFDLARIFALTKPAQFFNLAVDVDNYRFNEEFGQYLVGDRSYLSLEDIEVYGTGTPKTSYLNWIVDFEKQLGISATEQIKKLLDNLDVRLIYRLAGYSDKTLLKFFVEKGTPNSLNASLLIPDESYSVLLYDNQPFNKIAFSSVVVQRIPGGYQVFGNSQSSTYFKILEPVRNGNNRRIEVERLGVNVAKDYQSTERLVPYGTRFSTPQEVAQFLSSYAAWLEDKGMIFDAIENGIEVNWRLMVSEFLYWAQSGWENGSIVTLNPSANTLKINKENSIVQPLTIRQSNFILNQNLYPIELNTLAVNREDTKFEASTLNQGDAISYAQFNMSNFEHGIVFDNTTLFNDVIYNLTTGLRQIRITVRGTKTAEWNGTVNAYGFIINQDNIQDWSREKSYTRGEIVLYKNKYWSALKVIQPSATFNENDWKLINYDDIQKGLLPNSATRSFESTKYYSIREANLEKDSNLLGYSLIGFRPRDYLALADLTDVTQVNVYRNLIENKGTRNAIESFKGTNLPQGEIDYDVYENWAIKTADFGGVLNDNYVQFRLNQDRLTGNPSIFSLTERDGTPGSQQEVPLYSLYDFNRTVDSPNILDTIKDTAPVKKYPDAGFVNFDDIKKAAYFFTGLENATDGDGEEISIGDFYVGDYLWLANFKDKWNVFSWKPAGRVIRVANSANNTAFVTFDQPHKLKKLEPLAIVNFAPEVDGYYIVASIVDRFTVTVNLPITANEPVEGLGIGLSFISQRVKQPGDIENLELLETEFTKTVAWVDDDVDGEWAVYKKSINYDYLDRFSREEPGKFGTAVAYEPRLGYLVSDPDQGKVFRYSFRNEQFVPHPQGELTEGITFGTAISHENNIYAISEPGTNGNGKIYLYYINDSILSDRLEPYQVIEAPAGVTGEWGTKLAMSNDNRWLYVSAQDDNRVYVYRQQNILLNSEFLETGKTYKIVEVGDTDWTETGAIENKEGIFFVAQDTVEGTGVAMQVNYEFAGIIDGQLFSKEGDNFGGAIATSGNGKTVAIGAPNKDFSSSITDVGSAYIYERTTQRFESRFRSGSGQTQTFNLAWTPDSTAIGVTATGSTNKITLANTTGINEDDPVFFTGLGLAGTDISGSRVYYIDSIDGNDITIKTSRSTEEIETVGTMPSITNATAHVQTTPLYVSVNGIDVKDNNYAIVNNTLVYSGTLRPGDVVEVSGNQFARINTFTSRFANRSNKLYGFDTGVSRFGNEILVGAPQEIDDDNFEGAVYRYTNGGASYGIVIGTQPCNLTTSKNILINGFLLELSPGDAASVARQINLSGITNVKASATEDNKLIIETVDFSLALICEKLCVTSYDTDALKELGISVFTETQIIKAPHKRGRTRFGNTIKFNESDTVVISAPFGTRVTGTTFDFSDNLILDDDTVFDNNATRFIDKLPNAGAVYMFDYLHNYNESLSNPGKFVYAQSLNSRDLEPGTQPLYGTAIDFVNNQVVIGTSDAKPKTTGGKITVYVNNKQQRNWETFRKPAPTVDVNKIQNVKLFNAITNTTLINLDYIDPLQGKLLGAVRQNIDYVSNVDPAAYNSNPDVADQTGFIWGEAQVGQIWFNTTGVRWINYHQNDPSYNAKYWGRVFPGSDVAVCTWVKSKRPPSQYSGQGTPININLFVTGSEIDSTDTIVPVYYFWVRGTNTVNKQLGKTLADTTIADYISNPKRSGISYIATLLPNAFAMYNGYNFLNGTNTVFQIGFSNGTLSDVSHEQYSLIRENFVDDFLPGLPRFGSNEEPSELYDRLIDSLAGADELGAIVPNPLLPKAKQSGILARPRQSFFFNRLEALKNYLLYANDVLKQYPIAEIRQDASFLFASGEFFDTTDYWEYVNWWADGFDDSIRSSKVVPRFADLATLRNISTGTIVTVEQNGDGKFEVYRYDGEGVWSRIGLENGTIQFKTFLWNFKKARIGFGDNFFDTSTFDEFPSEETRNIIRALNEQIYTQDLAVFRNKSLILLFEYIQSEVTDSENFTPWLNKTSLADVSHKVRELKPIDVFQEDNKEFLEGYINEVKPYHVVIKEFLFNYTGDEEYDGMITDFDLPAKYNSRFDRFITPQLVNKQPNNEFEYSADSPVWGDPEYQEWFANQGVAITGQPDYEITTLVSFVDRASRSIFVDNAQGFPVNGVITLGGEQIAYSFVDRAQNLLGGLIRGFNDTEVVDHIPGERIFIDLPPVVVLDTGRGYTEPPRVTAFIDETKYPAPTRPAQLEAVMSLDSVIQIKVIDPGQGYAVLPEIRIEPANTIFFANNAVSTTFHTIRVPGGLLSTGDLVQYQADEGVTVGRLEGGQWYYVNVLETIPSTIIALYSSFADAVNDRDRIQITAPESGLFKLNTGAKASAITTANPVRENITTLRFDRTTYSSRIQDWRKGAYYGSFFAGSYFNSESVSSSSIPLQATQPPIDTILASAQGAAFEIVDVRNDRNLEFSSFVRKVSKTEDGAITLIPQDDGTGNPNASGTTIGFVEDLPIKFVGAVVGGIVENEIYFIDEVINDTDFTIKDGDGNPVALSNATVGAQGLHCFTGDVVDTAVLTVNYPGIMTATKTTSVSNAITIPRSEVGTGGTRGFYVGLPVFFTGDVFGGIEEHINYFVTTVIDDESFTISTEEDIITTELVETKSAGDIAVVESTIEFSVNDPIIINNMFDENGDAIDDFGNIESGKTYFVQQIINDTQLKITNRVNGSPIELQDQEGTALVANQKNALQLTNATGNMTINVSLPVSPGQVVGQLFTLYGTSQQFPGLTPTVIADSLIDRTINATIGDGVDRIALSVEDGGTDNFYINLPIRVQKDIGGLVINQTYYVTEFSGEEFEPDPVNEPGVTAIRPNIQVQVTSTTADDDLICDTTESLYEGMRIVFSGGGLGGIVIGQEYFVKDIVDAERFTISDIPSGDKVELTSASGFMLGTGDPYIKVSESPGGSNVELSTVDDDPSSLRQVIEQLPEFAVSYILGGYRAVISKPGSGLVTGNILRIDGALVGGVTPGNNVTITVDTIDSTGGLINVIASGVVPQIPDKYYLKVRSPNELEVYSNPLMTVPVSGIDFEYVGFTTATATGTSSDDTITLLSVDGFVEGDEVVFTGDVPEPVVDGISYYIVDIDQSENKIKISNLPGGTAIELTNEAAEFKMAKLGSVALLPEPFFFNQSVVRFNNKVYICIISNNDDEFIFGKWELVRSDDRRLNALDRAIGYYQPTDNMPGLDLTQLFEGATYPNATYFGNPFAPAKQYPEDTILKPQDFAPTEVDIKSLVWNGENYLAAANTPDNSVVLGSASGEEWSIARVASRSVDITDIIFTNDLYVMTSTNSATPIYRSADGAVWSANGFFIQDSKQTSLPRAGLSLNSIAFNNDAWVAVGDNIVRSLDTFNWTEVHKVNLFSSAKLFGVAHVSIPSFTGFIAVGKGKRPDFSTGVTQLVDSNVITVSTNGENWSDVSSLTFNGLYGVASDGTTIVSVGENGAVYASTDGFNWSGVNETVVTTIRSNNRIIISDSQYLEVGDKVRFSATIGELETNKDYFIIEIDGNFIRVSETLGGPEVEFANTITAQAQIIMRVQDASDPNPETLRDLIYANDIWLAVGDNGTIKISTDFISWTLQDSGTTENLTGAIYNEDEQAFVVVGDNNTTLISKDDGITWIQSTTFTVAPPIYTVKGDDFEQGYAPEELVAGVVSDTIQMEVTTRPGTNWDASEFSHTGYNVVSVELEPEFETQVEYSFDGLVQFPAKIFVQLLDAETKLGTTLPESEYTIDWIEKKVILNQPLVFSPNKQALRIDVYEVGNGNQLAKSSTDVDPIRTQGISQFNEIYLSANYSENIFNGGGVIRPGTGVIAAEVYETEEGTDRIFVDDVSKFIVNSQITFEGATFGGLEESKPYFVKTISTVTNSITVSATRNEDTGVAGPTKALTNATGFMIAKIQIGSGAVWSDPIIYRNGVRLVLGKTNIVTRTKSSNNTLVTNDTAGMIVGTPIVFCAECPFGESGIDGLTQYFIHSKVSPTEFRVSDTLGGPAKTLTDATGSTRFITDDYSFGIQPDGKRAKIIFPTNTLSNSEDYIVYSVFGQSDPEQYGYTIPETQTFIGNGTSATFKLTNAIDLDNPRNAIVEIDGVRQTISRYDICSCNDAITFFTPPPAGSLISVTTYNDTRRQYLNTQYGITGSPGSAFVNIEATETINTTGTFDQDDPEVQSFDQTNPVVVTYDEDLNFVVVSDVSELNINDTIVFTGVEFGGLVAGRNYYIVEIIPGENPGDPDKIVISEEVGGAPAQLTNATGSMFAVANGITVVPIVNVDNNIAPPLATTRAIETDADTNEITVENITGFVSGQTIVFRGTAFGDIATDGTVYFVGEINGNKITIEDQFGNTIDLQSDTGVMLVEVGGRPTVRITTGAEHLLEPNLLVRMDGITGSTQVNNNIYYARIIDDFTFDIYNEPFSADVGIQITTNDTATVAEANNATSTTITIPTGDISGQLVIGMNIKDSTEFLPNDAEITNLEVTSGNTIITVSWSAPISFTETSNVSIVASKTTAVNSPVTAVTTYTGGGFAWRAGTFYLSSAIATGISNNEINVVSTAGLIAGTPVYFTQSGFLEGDEILGGLIQGKKYFIREISTSPVQSWIKVSELRFGEELTLVDGTGTLSVAQWEQVNVDRLWVTVNGLRVPSSKLRINADGEVGILTEIHPGDEVIITSMINYASPDEQRYLNLFDRTQDAVVFRANADTRTWIEEPVYELSSEIKLNNVRQVTNFVVDEATVPAVENGFYFIPITAEKRIISGVEVVNNTTNKTIHSSNVKIEIIDTLPVVRIRAGNYISEGDELTITTLEGNTIILNGEQIRFATVDFETNTIGQLQRGVNGTAVQTVIPQYSTVYGLLAQNRLPDALYSQVWNSNEFNEEPGDPLQISQTAPAEFLRAAS